MMATFMMLTRVSADATQSPQGLEALEKDAMRHVRRECPEVEWLHSYAACGPYDYVDIFSAPDFETALKVSMLIRTFGHAHTELWPVTPWRDFKRMIHGMPHAA